MGRKIKKPVFDYTRDPINAEKFGVPPFLDDEREPKEYESEGNVNPRDLNTPQERENKDVFIDEISDINREMQELEDRILEEIEDINIPFDLEEHPGIYNSLSCPNCGKGENCPSVLSGHDFVEKKRDHYSRSSEITSFASKGNAYQSSSAAVSAQQKWLNNRTSSMLILVLIQILIWILERVYKFFRPLRRVPFARAIPNSIRSLIRNLKHRFNRSRDFSNEMSKAFREVDAYDRVSSEEGEEEWDYDTISDELEPPEKIRPSELSEVCLQHYEDWKMAYYLLKDNDPVGFNSVMAYETHQQMKESNQALEDMMARCIEPGYVSENGNTLNGNVTSDEHLPDPAERLVSDLDPDGNEFHKIALDEKRKYIQQTKRLLDDTMNSDEILCCFIYNLTVILEANGVSTSYSDMRKVLPYIAAIVAVLELYRNYLQLDIMEELEDLGNFINNLVNGLIHEVISSYIQVYTGIFRGVLQDWLKSATTIRGSSKFQYLRDCLPFEEFLNILPTSLQRLLDRFNSLLKSMWYDWLKTDRQAQKNQEINLDLRRLNHFIKILNDILSYSKFWLDCTDEAREDLIQKTQESTTKFRNTPYDDKGKTSNVSNSLDMDRVEETAAAMGLSKEMKDSLAASLDIDLEEEFSPRRSGMFSYDGLKVLLVNFLGVSPETVNDVLYTDESGELCCKKGFTPQEVENLRGLFNGNI